MIDVTSSIWMKLVFSIGMHLLLIRFQLPDFMTDFNA